MDCGSRIIILVILLIYCSGKSFATQNDSSKVENDAQRLFNEFWEWKLVNNPQFATKVGIFKYDNRLTEMSLSSYQRRADAVRIFLDRTLHIAKSVRIEKNLNLSMNLMILRDDLEQYLSGMKFRPYLFPINNMEGPQNDYINLISMMKKNTVSDLNNIIGRIRLFDQQINEMIALLREGMRLGLTMNRRSFEKMIVIYGKIASEPIESNPFFVSFKEKPVKITQQSWNIIVNDAKTTIKDYVQPSFRKLQYFLWEEYLQKSRPGIGVSTLPLGKDYYRALLKYHTTTNLSPQEVHLIGLKEVTRITGRMETIKDQVGFKGTLSQFRDFLRKDKRFGFLNEDEILSYYRNIETEVRKTLPKYISKQPTLPFRIAPVPHDLAPTAPFAYYDEPSPDGTKPGTFYVNTYQPETRRKYIARSLFCHEGLPGHHIQIASKIEFGSPLLFRRYMGMDSLYYEAPACFSRNSAYTEGWGLYAEYLGEEMGLYSNPYDLFGRLSQEMLRAVRLVVDTGMHVLGWSRQKAIDYMRANTAGNLHDIISEIDRYISWPGQACSYKIGEIKIRELRRVAEKELGTKFDLRDFHAFIISMGNIPLYLLEIQFKIYLKKKLL